MASWYVRRGEKVVGPFDVSKLKELAALGKLLPTDQLAKDAGGPWTEAKRTILFGQSSKQKRPPSQDSSAIPPLVVAPLRPEVIPPAPLQQRTVLPPSTETVRASNAIDIVYSIVGSMGRGLSKFRTATLRSLSTRAQRNHELKLARIKAKALTGATQAVGNQQPAIHQQTVVKVINRNSSCGCSGCGLLALLIFLLFVGVSPFCNLERRGEPTAGTGSPPVVASNTDSVESTSNVYSEAEADVAPQPDQPATTSGWIPSEACSFLEPMLVTRGYKQLFDDEYYCSSPYKDIGQSDLRAANNLAYYVTGGANVADTLKLVLNYNQPANATPATNQLVAASKTLSLKATGSDLPPSTLAALSAGRSAVEVSGEFQHEVKRDDWPTGRGYDVQYIVTKSVER